MQGSDYSASGRISPLSCGTIVALERRLEDGVSIKAAFVKKEVACCLQCAEKASPEDVPDKVDWCRREENRRRLRHSRRYRFRRSAHSGFDFFSALMRSIHRVCVHSQFRFQLTVISCWIILPASQTLFPSGRTLPPGPPTKPEE